MSDKADLDLNAPARLAWYKNILQGPEDHLYSTERPLRDILTEVYLHPFAGEPWVIVNGKSRHGHGPELERLWQDNLAALRPDELNAENDG